MLIAHAELGFTALADEGWGKREGRGSRGEGRLMTRGGPGKQTSAAY